MLNKPLKEYDLEEVVTAPPLALSLHWKDDKLIELRTRWAEDVEESAKPSGGALQLKAALERYVSRENPNWPDLPYDFSHLSNFQRAALEELQRIPSGATRTYKELATRVGKPKGAQAMGRAMGANPFPVVYPCHRVIASDGKLTGFSAKDGLKMKVWLLRHEGAIL